MSRSSYCGAVAETPLNQEREEMSMCRDAAIQGLKGMLESIRILLNWRYAIEGVFIETLQTDYCLHS